MPQDNSIPLQAFAGESPVDNYLQSYYQAKQQKRADQQAMQQDKIGQQTLQLNDLNLHKAKVDALNNLLASVPDGNPQAFEQAKQQALANPSLGLKPEDVANLSVADLPRLRMQTGQAAQMLDMQLKQAQIDASRASTQHSLAATQALREKPPAGVDPNTGQPVVKLTEGQAKDLSYYRRGVASNNKLDDARSKEMMSGWNSTFADAPIIGNAWLSPSARQGQQAAKDFIAAILRRDTGAAVSDQEFNYYASFLLPQYGDDATTLAQKKESRAQALESIRAGLGTAEILAKIGPQPADPNADTSTGGVGAATNHIDEADRIVGLKK